MEFKNSKGIFQQIADKICENIITGELRVGSKLLSVREHSAKVGVNQNTIMRAYTELQREGIITNKRGIGYFVNDTAPSKIQEQRRNEFFNYIMPDFIKHVKLLKLSEGELKPVIKQLKENNNETQ